MGLLETIVLVIQSDAGELRLERDLERWVAPDFGTEVAAEDVNNLLELITRRRAPQMNIVQQIPDDYSTITLYGFGGGPYERLDVAAFALVVVGAAISGLIPLGFRRR